MEGIQMKSLHYITLVSLITSVMTGHAMLEKDIQDNEQAIIEEGKPEPVAQALITSVMTGHALFKKRIQDIDQAIQQEGKQAFIDTMEPVAQALNSRCCDTKQSGCQKYMPACIAKMSRTPLYPANIIGCLEKSLGAINATTSRQLKKNVQFNKQYIESLMSKHIAEKTRDQENQKIVKAITDAIRLRRGAHYFANAIARQTYKELPSYYGGLAQQDDTHAGLCAEQDDTHEHKVASIENTLRIKKGASYFAHRIALEACKDLQTSERLAHEESDNKPATSSSVSPMPVSTRTDNEVSPQGKAICADIEKTLDYAIYHAFNEATREIALPVYDYLARKFGQSNQDQTAAYYPHTIASDLISARAYKEKPEEKKLTQCKNAATLNDHALTEHIRKTIQQKNPNKITLPGSFSTDSRVWMERAARNWYNEETARRKAESHASGYGLNNPHINKFDNNYQYVK